jgi:glycosyltransferase involved in cell wall biosynthesis
MPELQEPLVAGKPEGEQDANARAPQPSPEKPVAVALLTGGGDKPYALGMAGALIAQGTSLDFIGSDEVNGPQLHDNPRVNFLNLRGDQSPNASRLNKLLRITRYYLRLLRYAATARPRVFHVLWNNKFELLDRTVLMLYYRLLGKRVLLTAHNVNAGKRDGKDTAVNRLSLKIQYGLSDHIFVHTEKMKCELMAEFGTPAAKVTVIPFGINNTVPNTEKLSTAEAKRTLGLNGHDKALLFFGNIAPYKGLQYLVAAFEEVAKRDEDYRLIVAGVVKDCDDYWREVQEAIKRNGAHARVIERIEYIPDEAVELYFKAADVLILPYTHIFQSGVLFLGYSFGLPVIAADVGSLREEIVEGRTGFVCRPRDALSLAGAIERYFASELYHQLGERRLQIRDYANERYSWTKIGQITKQVYAGLLAA